LLSVHLSLLEELVENYRSEAYPEPPEGERKHNWRRTVIDIIETILLSVILFLGINAVSSRIRVESISMQPTLYAGNFVFVNKLAYQWGEPSRGDIIVFRWPPDPTQVPYIKRVIGLPGETIKVAGGKVYINDQLLAEQYLGVSTHHDGEWLVPEDHLFVMGDNRNNSSDSRSWGTVPIENVIGKAEVVYWPPEQWGLLNFPAAVAAEH
jgi:signal peptidase I